MKKVLTHIFFLFFSAFANGVFCQSYHFQGNWTKINTSYIFDFELSLHQSKSNQVEGFFIWKLVRYDEKSALSKNHYRDKVGLTAKEYVRGSFNKAKNVFFLEGFKKDDPHNIIALDIYRLSIDESGNLGGVTKSNHSWKGRINGENISQIVL